MSEGLSKPGQVECDSYREVINSPITYTAIATELASRHRAIVGWTDGQGSHFDLLLALGPTPFGENRRGLRGYSDLFVGVLGCGCFGFDVTRSREPRHVTYIAEKLCLREDSTSAALTELINGIVAALPPSAGCAQ